MPRRGKNRDYTQLFETAWKLYGRKEEKGQAFMAWLVASGWVGGEDQLLSLVITALRWQGPNWGSDGWRFAPYFERYLKKRRWEDEPLPMPTAPPVDRRPAWKREAEAPAPYHRPAPASLPGLRDWATDLPTKKGAP